MFFCSLSECGLPPGLETKKILESTQVLFSRNLNSHYLVCKQSGPFFALILCLFLHFLCPLRLFDYNCVLVLFCVFVAFS